MLIKTNEGLINMATLTATEFAAEVNSTGREVRKFLRADAAAKDLPTPGKGSRYAIEKKQLASLKKRFAAWDEARKVPTPAAEVDTQTEDEVDEVIAD